MIGHSYVSQLESKGLLVDREEYQFTYWRQGGSTFAYWLDYFKDFECYQADYHPALILVILGGNDFNVGTGAEEVRARAHAFFKRLLHLYPGAKIVRVEVEVRHYGEDSGHPRALPIAQFLQESKRFNRWLHKQWWAGLCTVAARGALGFFDPSYYKKDGIYLNLGGLQLLAKGLVNAVRNFCLLPLLPPLEFAFELA